jgi:hypothetical protein
LCIIVCFFVFLLLAIVLSLLYRFILCCDVRYDFHIKRCSVRLYLQLFVGGLTSYLHYLCLFAYSGVHIVLCFCFVFLRLCTLCCQFLLIVHFWLPLRYSVTFILVEHCLSLFFWPFYCLSFELRLLIIFCHFQTFLIDDVGFVRWQYFIFSQLFYHFTYYHHPGSNRQTDIYSYFLSSQMLIKSRSVWVNCHL